MVIPSASAAAIRDLVDRVAEEQGLTKSQSAKMEKAVYDIFEGGLLPKDALGISDDSVEAIYAYAYRLYQGAKYKNAGHIFRFLQSLNPKDPRFYLGMGACAHRLEDYETAVFMYEVASEFDKEDPMPLYYAYDCKIKLGRIQGAYRSLMKVAARCRGKKEYAAILDRAMMTLHSLKKSMREVPK